MKNNNYIDIIRCKLVRILSGWRHALNPAKNIRTLAYHLMVYKIFCRKIEGLHLGCGSTIINGFINIDAQHTSPCDIISSIYRLKFSNGSVHSIYACHVLEHIPRYSIMDSLKEWYRVLQPDGTLFIAVPDIEQLFKIYQEELKSYESNANHDIINLVCEVIFGGQSNAYDTHYHGYSFPTLKSLLLSAGFREIHLFNRETLTFAPFRDAAYAKIDNKPISLNVMAIK